MKYKLFNNNNNSHLGWCRTTQWYFTSMFTFIVWWFFLYYLFSFYIVNLIGVSYLDFVFVRFCEALWCFPLVSQIVCGLLNQCQIYVCPCSLTDTFLHDCLSLTHCPPHPFSYSFKRYLLPIHLSAFAMNAPRQTLSRKWCKNAHWLERFRGNAPRDISFGRYFCS